jgi:hypothetical protein
VSIIKQALNRLRHSVDSLEGGVDRIEFAMAGKQRDMFGAVVPQKKGQAAFPLENAVIAQRLDKAIKKVEELLES